MYFSEKSLWFLSDLALNNEKTWFDAHRAMYEEMVKQPFDALLQAVIDGVKTFDTVPDLPLTKFRFRINRDVRFSKDKTPYNPWLSAAIGPEGKAGQGPFHYFRIGADGVDIGGGVYQPTTEQLQGIRQGLVDDAASLHRAVSSKPFTSFYEHFGGEEQYKVLPKAFKKAAEDEPLLREKSFTYMVHYPQDVALREDMPAYIIDHYKAARKVNAWLAGRLG